MEAATAEANERRGRLSHAVAVFLMPVLALTGSMGARVLGLTRVAAPAVSAQTAIVAPESVALLPGNDDAPPPPAEASGIPEQQMVNEILAAKLLTLNERCDSLAEEIATLRGSLRETENARNALQARVDVMAAHASAPATSAAQPLADVVPATKPTPDCLPSGGPSPGQVSVPSPGRGNLSPPVPDHIVELSGDLPDTYSQPFDASRLPYVARRALASEEDTYGGHKIAARYEHARGSVFGPTTHGRDPGDNGRSYWGFAVGEGGAHGVALPPAVYERVGVAAEVRVKISNQTTGKSVIAPIVDVGPSKRVWAQQGPTIDMTQAVAEALGCQVINRHSVTDAADLTFEIVKQ